jgi:hypothetical protein
VDNSTSAAYADSSRATQVAFAPTGAAGSPLFVINLYASMAPVSLPSKALPGLESYKLYQVSRREDGRTRYRIRLGFFATEAEAETVLEQVRAEYPTAFVACVCEEDQRYVRGFAMPSPPPLRVISAPQPAPAMSAPASATKATPAAATTPAKPAASTATNTTAPRARASVATNGAAAAPSASKPAAPQPVSTHEIELTFAEPPAPSAPAKAAIAPDEPFHVGRFNARRGLALPDTNLTLANEPTTAQAPSRAPASPTNSSALTAEHAASLVEKKPVPIPKSAANMHLEFDSTQTLRALTAVELEDESQEKWFAIELAVSDQPVNLDAMPHLDIFDAYRVYSVANAANGKITHSLRLGFFKEAVSAEAVAGYLKTFFAAPNVIRVSIAEHTRFKDAMVRKRPASYGAPNVIELADARATRVPTVTLEVAPAAKPAAPERNQAHAAKSAALPTKRSAPLATKKSTAGKSAKKSLSDELLEEARRAELSASGNYKAPKNGLLSRLVGKLKKS